MYPDGDNIGVRMWQVRPGAEDQEGGYRIIDGELSFHPVDAPRRKTVTYESVQIVHRTTRGRKVVKLKP
jgi:hypothetical protein